MVKEITTLDEYHVLRQGADGKLAVIDFYATWCGKYSCKTSNNLYSNIFPFIIGPCKMIAPHIEQLDAELPDVHFAKVTKLNIAL
jgi:thiol-disulfide isomerase/thioredoxin